MPTPFTDQQSELAYIRQKAAQLGLDPEAVLAVATHEGITLPAQVGDHGTSFGPWQLHGGASTTDPQTRGALPQSVWQQGPEFAAAWANSQEGIDYALGRIQTIAGGQTGAQAVQSIVSRFERPTNIPGEVASSLATYQQGGIPGAPHGFGQIAGTGYASTTPNLGGIGVIPGATAAVDAITGPINSLEKFLQFVSSWRFVEVVGGFALLLVGLVIVAKGLGIGPPIGGPIGKAAGGASAGAGSTFDFEPGEAAYASSQRTSRQGTPRGRTQRVRPLDQPARKPSRISGDRETVPF